MGVIIYPSYLKSDSRDECGYVYKDLQTDDGKINIGTVFRPEFVTDAEARARIGSLKEDNLTLGAFSSSVFDAEESMFGDFKTIGDTKAKEEVRKMSGAFMSMQRQFNSWRSFVS